MRERRGLLNVSSHRLTPLAAVAAAAVTALGALGSAACGGDPATGASDDAAPSDPDVVFATDASADTGVPLTFEDATTSDAATTDAVTSTDTADAATDTTGAPCEGRPFGFQCACEVNTDCASGYCLPVDDPDAASRCTKTCIDECPDGWQCTGVATGGDPVFLCQPPVATLCAACVEDADCREVGAKCLAYPDGHFCGRQCLGDPTACPDGFGCAEIRNDLGQVTSYQCTPDGGSCVCPADTDYQNDALNCGYCGHACAFDHAAAGCSGGGCAMGLCEDGHQDLNHDQADGCEYGCTFTASDDEPEVGCETSDGSHPCDEDCDGIDGTWARAVFVAPNGVRNASGAPYDPLPSIQAGIDLAAADSRDGIDHVYVAGGTYTETVTLTAGVSVFGGFSADGRWTRDLGAHPSIVQSSSGSSSVRVVVADGIAARTVFDGFTVLAGTNANPGGSSYAIWVRGSTDALVLANLVAIGGNGGPGVAGQRGDAGPNGATGDPGQQGSKNCSDTRAQGGAGGANQCTRGDNARGGDGGDAGCDSFLGSDTDPDNGSPSAGGAAGGSGSGDRGDDGGTGAQGTDGLGGGAAGEVVQGFWRGFAGVDGGDGRNGVGGGGGAGGAGGINIATGRWGGGGGGGGAGGCGGGKGTGGTAGGGSFGLFVVDASPTLRALELGHKSGGTGGNGGAGGARGTGQAGGRGGDPYDSHASGGGGGGTGGDGGRGGHGGGGAGGVAFGLYVAGSSDPRCESVSWAPPGAGGTGGLGGTSADGAGNKGKDGDFGDRNKATPSCP